MTRWHWIAIGGGGLAVLAVALVLWSGVLSPIMTSDTPTVVATVPAAAGSPAAGAAAAAPKAAWATRCTSAARADAPDCTVEQRVIVGQTRQLLAGVAVTVNHTDRKPAMMLQVPVGLFLPAGVSFQLDGGAPQKLPLQTCDGSGCYAATPVSDELLQQLQSGKTMTIVFQGLNKQEIKVPMPIEGFTAAFDRVK